ncbi:MAG: phenylalanine--tRNA ligase subunit beta [Chlamydiae bacterium]|nr:phenylalanine--tRNA ligase subunit beta [Chlamydiota bacterium]
MKAPLSWLKEFLDLSLTPEKISEVLTLAGLEVDAVTLIGSNFSGVVVAKVLSTIPHPNADRLCVATVTDGTEELQIVCGAKNCRPGLITALAKIGASLPPDESGKPFKIKKGKLRDVESFGMLCAADELGLSKEGEGIMELSEEFPLGTDISSLFSDAIFDISLTPNLGHCLSIQGIARELSALLDIPLKKQALSIQESSQGAKELLKVDIQDTERCNRYMARVVKNVKVGPSPDWLKRKIESCGLRSINNVVDISNFIMLGFGQPLHMFDYDKIAEHKIIVASGTPHKHLKTLDAAERALPEDLLLICDPTKPLAIAGIMGGDSSAVSESTTNIVIEAALFSPKAIRKGCKDLSLKSDSSQRFERGVDAEAIAFALDKAAELLSSLANGEIAKGVIDHNVHPFIAKKITCRLERVQSLLGIDISLREVATLLQRLHIKVVKEHASSLELLIPAHRNDINAEVDLIEEVMRIYGYNNVPKRKPLHVSSSLMDAPMYLLENEVRERLISEGLQEQITCDLISPALSELTKEPSNKDFSALHVLQSKSADYSVLRGTLLGGLLECVKHNSSHQNMNLSGFEVGRVHFRQGDKIEELSCAAIVLTGLCGPHHHDPKPRMVDFYDLKGIIENLCSFFKIEGISFEPSHLHNFQPGRQARIKRGDITLGVIGQVHPATLQKLDCIESVYYAEINLHELLSMQNREIRIESLAQFPGSERDWTLTVKKETPVASLLQAVNEVPSTYLEKVYMLDLFESEKLGKDRKNVTLRFSYRDKEKTLSYESIEAEHMNLTQKVAEKLGNCLL